MTRLPDFLGIGAQRAGTTWLDALLRSHPDLWLPERRKELHFFDTHYERGLEWYADFFRAAPARCSPGEITPRYLFDPNAPARIARHLERPRLIAILRDPVQRAFSQYALTVRDEAYQGDFARFLAERPDALERGLYHLQLSRYLELFPRESLCVLVFEHVRLDEARALEELAGFLGVDPAGFDLAATRGARNEGRRKRFAKSYAAARRAGEWLREHDWDAPVNVAKKWGLTRLFGSQGRLAPLDEATCSRLREHFAQDRRALGEELGLDLSGWG